MHSRRTVDAALALAATGAGASEVSRELGISRSTVKVWLAGRLPRFAPSGGCDRCRVDHRFAELPAAYVYLLGLYLGDGCIADYARGVYRLRVSLDAKYPAIIEDCVAAIGEVAPSNRVGRYSHGTWFEIYCYSKSWVCLFPQHGPGKKHDRRIELTDWQRSLVAQWPDRLLRGLIQSDGHRFQNTGRRGWSAPRYAFTNHSDDIRAIFCDACDRMELRWTASGPYTIYVSRKADVARLDQFVGPKR